MTPTVEQLMVEVRELKTQAERLRRDNEHLAQRKSYKVKYPQFVVFYVDSVLKYGEIVKQEPNSIRVKVVYPYLVEETTVKEIYSFNWLVDRASSLEGQLSSANYDIKLKEKENMGLLLQLRETSLELAKYKNAEATSE